MYSFTSSTARRALCAGLTLSSLLLCGCSAGGPAPAASTQSATPGKLIARIHPAGFRYAHDTYNGLSIASDGKIYYVLCSERYDVGAKMYSYDAAADRVQYLGDLTEASGERDLKAVVQGKAHTNFVESNGKLYFATHIGYYNSEKGFDLPGIPPSGYQPYPGGHFLSYDLKSGKFESLARAPVNHGFQSFAMDTQRQRIYGLIWPTGHFLRYDMKSKELKDIGAVSLGGESVLGPDFRTICRSPQVDPEDGSVYFTRADGAVLRYRYDSDAVEPVEGVTMKTDYLGSWDPSSPGTMAYNWRKTFWYAPDKMIYGVHGNSGYLFRFDPRAKRIELLDRITSSDSKKIGMYDQFTYGYLGFTLGPDGHTVYYLTGAPLYVNGKRVVSSRVPMGGESMADEEVHLVTYDLAGRQYTDHGAILFENGQHPSYCQSLAVSKDGVAYTISRVPTSDGTVRTDLISVKL